jgi:hypothetical protein
MPLMIPEAEWPRLARLMATDAKARRSILTALRDVKPSASRRKVGQEVIAALGEHFERSAAFDLGNLLTNLYWLRADQASSAELIAKQVITFAKRSGSPQLEQPKEGWEAFKEFLQEALSFDANIGASTKAVYLALQAPRHFRNARVLTDIRPVFPDSAEQTPSAFTVLHTLQIEFEEDGEGKEWFLSLDTDDLHTLLNAASRALEKEGSVVECLQKTGVPILTWREG